MIRCLLAASLCLVVHGRLLAGETSDNLAPLPSGKQAPAYRPGSSLAPATLQPVSDAKPAKALSGRKKLEAQLQTPAKLDFGQRKMVSVKEVIDQLHEQHQLSIRFDSPTLAVMFGLNSSGSQPNSIAHLMGDEECCKPEAATVPQSEAPRAINVLVEAKPVAQTNDKPAAKLETQLSAKPQSAESPEQPQSQLDDLLKVAVNIQNIDLANVSVATVLRHTLDAVPSNILDDEVAGLPIVPTNAWLLDYVVEDDGLLITPRLNALTLKETRVYSIKQFKNLPPEDLAKVIRHSVRPWSWRSQINDLGDRLKVAAPRLPSQVVSAIVKTGFQAVSEETGVTITTSGEPLNASAASSESKSLSQPTVNQPRAASDAKSATAEPTAADDAAIIDGLVTIVQGCISAVEIAHFAEPPTGTIQTLPGKLIITQSQAAHREIADLLKQLDEE